MTANPFFWVNSGIRDQECKLNKAALCFMIVSTLLFELQSDEGKVCFCNPDGLVIAHKLAFLEQMLETAGR